MIIELSWMEMMSAGQVGLMRQIEASKRNRSPRFPESYPGQLLANHVNAAIAEMAVCRLLGVYWVPSVNQFHVPDLEEHNIEVRYSTRADLKVRGDEQEARIVSVTGDPFGKLEIAGWCWGREAINDRYKKDPGNRGKPAFFIPHSALSAIEDLKLDPAS
mgnify:CR=1 FL=1|tara:strand:+ start:17389 stop:17868 length:480 start_codon:yes stop_codon:yes gene_type:complete